MSIPNFFDDNEFGSECANDTSWQVMGEPSLPMINIPTVQTNLFTNINDDDCLSNAATKGDPSSNGIPDDNSYVPPSVCSASTFPMVGGEQSINEQQMSVSGNTSTNSSGRQSAERTEEWLPSAALREWERRHNEDLAEKRTVEDEFKASKQKEAEKQISEWYKDRETRLETIRQQNRVKESQVEKLRQQVSTTNLAGNSEASWARVCELIESPSDGSSLVSSSTKLAMQGEVKASASGGKVKGAKGAATLNGAASPIPKLVTPDSKDTTRMRQLLLQLKTSGIQTNNQTFHSSPGVH